MKAYNKDFRLRIKDLKFQRNLFEHLLKLSPEGYLVVDEKDALIFINPSAQKQLNYSLWKEEKGSPALDCPLKEIFKNTRKLDFLTYHHDLEIVNPGYKILNVFCVPLIGMGDNPYRVFFIKDITKEKKAYEQDTLDATFSDSFALSAGIAHELGNPIASLSLHTQLLKRLLKKTNRSKDDTEQLNQSVEILDHELQRLDSTIHRFLDVVRPVRPQFVLASMNALLAQVLSILQVKAKEHQIILEIKTAEDEEPFLMDTAQITQALINLILNAMEASSPHDKVIVSVEPKQGSCEVTVQDFGEGIPPEKMGKLFAPYYTTKESGNGLGLLITYRIVKDHGGTLSVKSQPFESTSFIMNIPIRRKAVQRLPSRGL